jgi:hypothetical protein
MRELGSMGIVKISSLLLLAQIVVGHAQAQSYSLKQCEWGEGRITAKYTDIPECMPDTLYHWLPLDFFSWKLGNQSAGEDFLPFHKDASGITPMFSWRTPTGTHGYGDISIRLKLRQDIKFVPIFGSIRFKCQELKLEHGYDLESTVFVSWQRWMPMIEGGYLSEYILCSSGPVESWSYGTQEHLNEIIKEIKWIKSHKESEYDAFISGTTPWDTDVDKKDFSWENLLKRINTHQKLVKSGKIFTRDNVLKDGEYEEHFVTEKPIFFNEE